MAEYDENDEPAVMLDQAAASVAWVGPLGGHHMPLPPHPLPPEDRCTLGDGCDRPFETTIIGWAGGTGWVFDACWPCARRTIDVMSGWAA